MDAETVAFILERANSSIKERGVFSLVFSGGKTPISLFKLMTNKLYKSVFPWKKIHIFWSDERCVAPENTHSNYGKVLETLLSKVPLPKENIHRIYGELSSENAANLYETELHNFFEKYPQTNSDFDLILLGMGTDGHTASLFPETIIEFIQKKQLVAAVSAPKAIEPKISRVTLTYSGLDNSRDILFLVTGQEK